MATNSMTIPDVGEDVKHKILLLAEQLDITVAKLLILLLDIYERQFGQIRCTRPSCSTEDSFPVSGLGQSKLEFNTSPNHKQEHQNTSSSCAVMQMTKECSTQNSPMKLEPGCDLSILQESAHVSAQESAQESAHVSAQESAHESAHCESDESHCEVLLDDDTEGEDTVDYVKTEGDKDHNAGIVEPPSTHATSENSESLDFLTQPSTSVMFGSDMDEDLEYKFFDEGSEMSHGATKKKRMLPGCDDSCKRKCWRRLDTFERLRINEEYWSQDYCGRSRWLQQYMKFNKKSQNTSTRRSYTYMYMMPGANHVVQVCKKMFQRTLGWHSDSVIKGHQRWCQKTPERVTVVDREDQRGQNGTHRALDHEPICQHILSYHPAVSHNRNVTKRYLEPELTVKIMYAAYNNSRLLPRCAYPTYSRICRNEKLTFGHPRQEDCEMCLRNKLHSKDSGHDYHVPADSEDSLMSDVVTDCVDCVHAQEHVRRVVDSRRQYLSSKDDDDNDVEPYAVELQKVLLLPKLPNKQHHTMSRLVVFNETFASVDPKKSDHVILWHEAISGRRDCDIASSFIKVLKSTSAPHVVFWADNSIEQHKNYVLFTALLQYINACTLERNLETVTIRYLEQGHTFLAPENVHGSICNGMRKVKAIYDFEDFVSVCRNSSKKSNVYTMQASDFYNFTSGFKSAKELDVPLNSLCEIRLQRNLNVLLYKTSFVQEHYNEVGLMDSCCSIISEFPRAKTEPRGINATKLSAISKLLEAAASPASKMSFWNSLHPKEEAADLVTCQDL